MAQKTFATHLEKPTRVRVTCVHRLSVKFFTQWWMFWPSCVLA